jgi:CheY-like chemotaxis protein
VTLPRALPPQGDAASASERPDGSPVFQRRRVLIVDDNVDAARMLAMYLEVVGHEVMVEHSAGIALERTGTAHPDVCILDIGLPEIDGNTLARMLRARSATAGALLIALTGYGQEQDRERAMAAGFDHFLVKPVDAGAMLDLIEMDSAGR